MAAILGSYSPSHFQSLPALDNARVTVAVARGVYLEKYGTDLINDHF